jgi:predicted outer membrane protein
MDDRGAVGIVHASNLGEAQLGELTMRRAMRARVREFAALMVREHLFADASLLDAQGKTPRWGLTDAMMAAARFGTDSTGHMAHTGSIGTTGSAGYAGTGTAAARTVTDTVTTAGAADTSHAATSGGTGTMATSGSIGTTGSAGYANAGSSVGMSGATGSGSAVIASAASVASEMQRMSAADLVTFSALNGSAFDRAYIDNQVAAHAWMLQNLDTVLIPAVKDAALQTALRQIRARVALHLDAARDVQSGARR